MAGAAEARNGSDRGHGVSGIGRIGGKPATVMPRRHEAGGAGGDAYLAAAVWYSPTFGSS